MSHSKPTVVMIFTLPPELLERTLIITASCKFPSAIAHLSCTCRHFHRLVYCSTDNHLWREVFLTTFDDPRPLLRRLRDATSTAPTSNIAPLDVDIPFDWTGEFIRRMDAAKTIRRHMELTPSLTNVFNTQEKNSNPFPLSRAFEVLLSTLELASPFGPHSHEDFTGLVPTFPPIVVLHASPVPFPDEFKSLNAAWVEEILKKGYPPALVKRYILAGHEANRRGQHEVPEDPAPQDLEEGRIFHRLVFLKGFLPIPPELQQMEELSIQSGGIVRNTLQSAHEQIFAARERARRMVYSLRYLTPERCWGPFLPSTASTQDANKSVNSTFPDFEQELSRYTLSVSNMIVDKASSTSDCEDLSDEWLPESDEDEDSEDGDLSLIFSGRRTLDSTFVRPLPHQVIPDYAFLSAARLLVELNLQEILAPGESSPDDYHLNASIGRIVNAFACLDLGRMGGAPSFWRDSWPIRSHDASDEVNSITGDSRPLTTKKGKEKAKGPDVHDVKGWDWAGAAGQWKRSVCWLDYRDLLLHNLNGYPGETLEETMRIFPMTLRVSGYSKPPKPESTLSTRDTQSLVWRLPVIHIEGESKGSDRDSNEIRKVKGTVRMLRDGAVRWSLTSCYPGEDAPEWQTEGIQIGSIGSAVGVLGMWTGAEHASTDPLGPVWAWKVA